MIQLLRLHASSAGSLALIPAGSDSKESACNVGDPGSIAGSGRSPGGGNGNPLQYSCLENPTDRGAWWATRHGVATWTRLSAHTHTHSKKLRRGTRTPWMPHSRPPLPPQIIVFQLKNSFIIENISSPLNFLFSGS